MEWNHICEYCGRGLDTKGLRIHISADCKVARGLYVDGREVDRVVDVPWEPHERFYRVRWKGYEGKDDTWQNWRGFEDGRIDTFWETQDVFERDKPACDNVIMCSFLTFEDLYM